MAFNHIQKLRRVDVAANKQGVIRLAVRCQFVFDVSDQLGRFKVFFGVFVPQHQLSEFDFQTTGKGRIAEIQVVHDDADDVEAVILQGGFDDAVDLVVGGHTQDNRFLFGRHGIYLCFV